MAERTVSGDGNCKREDEEMMRSELVWATAGGASTAVVNTSKDKGTRPVKTENVEPARGADAREYLPKTPRTFVRVLHLGVGYGGPVECSAHAKSTDSLGVDRKGSGHRARQMIPKIQRGRSASPGRVADSCLPPAAGWCGTSRGWRR